MNDRELLEAAAKALEALEAMQSYAAAERKGLRICDESITALKAALAEPIIQPEIKGHNAEPEQPEPDAIEQALAHAEAFSRGHDAGWQSAMLCAALTQSEQEPVAWMVTDKDGRHFIFRINKPVISEGETLAPLYTHPAAPSRGRRGSYKR